MPSVASEGMSSGIFLAFRVATAETWIKGESKANWAGKRRKGMCLNAFMLEDWKK